MKEVEVKYEESGKMASIQIDRTSSILLQNLRCGADEGLWTKTLSEFELNLERLARLDKLSVLPVLNCFEAIGGIFHSLNELHKWDIGRLQKLQEQSTIKQDQEQLSHLAMMKEHGRPLMHAHGRIGMTLEYWQSKRHHTTHTTLRKSNDWTLSVECMPMAPMLFAPCRVSDDWLSDEIAKPNGAIGMDDQALLLDWQEPENAIIPPVESSKSDTMAVNPPANSGFADVMFVAKFEPPIIVPYNVAVHIHTITNVPLDVYQQSTFDGLLFPLAAGESREPGEARTLSQDTKIHIINPVGERSSVIHHNTLYFEKVDFGRCLTQLPFSHPRNLVDLLPMLRQYAFFSTILRNSFGPDARHETSSNATAAMLNKRDQFARLMMSHDETNDETVYDISLDVSVSVQQNPRLQVVFPLGEHVANIVVDIKPNAVVEVISQNLVGLDGPDADAKASKVHSLGKALELTENLGTWAAFIKRRYG